MTAESANFSFKTLFQFAFQRQPDFERVASVQFLTNRAPTPNGRPKS